MRLSLRFVLPLLLALGAFAWAAVPLVDAWMTRWYIRDLDTRSSFVANTVQEPLDELLRSGATGRIAGYFNRLTDNERLYAVGLCTDNDAPVIASSAFPAQIRCGDVAVRDGQQRTLVTTSGTLRVIVRPTPLEAAPNANLILVHNLAFLASRTEESRRYLFYFFLALSASVALITVVIAQMSWRGWVSGLRALLHGEGILRRSRRGHRARAEAHRARRQRAAAGLGARLPPHRRQPAALDAGNVARDAARRIARQRHHRRLEPRAVHPRAQSRTAFASSIRRAAWSRPWSRSCAPARARGSRTAAARPTAKRWTATIGSMSRPTIPPTGCGESGSPTEEESGYYDGFANEGLWPLCHNAYVRPEFRKSDWDYYRLVNARFADAVVREAPARIRSCWSRTITSRCCRG